MERFVFVAAITIAIIFGVFAMFGSRHFNFGDIDVEAGGMAPMVELTAGSMEQQTFQGDNVRIKSAAAHVVIMPEDRSDYLIEIDNAHGRTPMPTVSSDDGRITIDGQLRGRIQDCTEGGGATLRGYGDVSSEDLPRITIHAPRVLTIDRGGAGTTEIGATQSLNLDFAGCGSATVADVAQELSLDVAGSGHVQASAAGSLNADIAGSAQVSVGAVAGGADLDLAGSGTVAIASLTGAFSADGAGSGNIDVNGGAITTANIDLAGSGDIDIAAPVQDLTVSIVGSGNVDVTAAVGDINAEIAGSGGVRVQSATGTVHKEIFGSGNVTVGP